MNNVKLVAVLFALYSMSVQLYSKEPKSLLCKTDELIFEETFATDKIDSRWQMHKGDWQIVNGSLQGSELEKDNHAASIRTDFDLPDNFVMEFEFKFNGGKVIHCSFNGRGHICRATITPEGYTLKGEKVKKDPEDKSITVGQVQQKFEKGKSYTMRIEVAGEEMVARVEDGPVAFGKHAKIARDKTNFGFPMAGVSANIDNIRIWSANLNSEWSSIKSKLPPNRIVPSVPPTPTERFSRLDKNLDKKLSLKEYVGSRPKEKQDLATKQFKRKDKNQDGFLSISEF